MSDSSVRSAGDRPFSPFPRPSAGSRGVAALLQTTEDREYREMELAFHASGGLASSDEVTRLLSARTDQPISALARWIVAHDLVSFEWNSHTMIPLFQFDMPGMALRPEVTEVIRELAAAMDDWEICLWFARPNAWLGNRAPVDVLDADPRALHDAARADRYLARA